MVTSVSIGVVRMHHQNKMHMHSNMNDLPNHLNPLPMMGFACTTAYNFPCYGNSTVTRYTLSVSHNTTVRHIRHHMVANHAVQHLTGCQQEEKPQPLMAITAAVAVIYILLLCQLTELCSLLQGGLVLETTWEVMGGVRSLSLHQQGLTTMHMDSMQEESNYRSRACHF